MKTDLVLSSFNPEMSGMLAAAVIADGAGFSGVWTYDHFSAAMVDKSWSIHPFTALGAIAAVTERVELGCLVANMVNRHPSQLASAVGTLSALAPGRVLCGVGSGAGPGSTFDMEHKMIGRELKSAKERRVQLVETIEMLKSIWAGASYQGEYFQLNEPSGILPPVPIPPIIVGASSLNTALLAAKHADGVNLFNTSKVLGQVRRVLEVVTERDPAAADRFDLSIMDDLDLSHPLGGETEHLVEAGFTRRTLALRAPYPLDRLREIAENLEAARS